MLCISLIWFMMNYNDLSWTIIYWGYHDLSIYKQFLITVCSTLAAFSFPLSALNICNNYIYLFFISTESLNKEIFKKVSNRLIGKYLYLYITFTYVFLSHINFIVIFKFIQRYFTVVNQVRLYLLLLSSRHYWLFLNFKPCMIQKRSCSLSTKVN